MATNDSHYVHREDHESHDALLCVQTGATLSDPKRFKFEGQEHYLKTAAEMRYLFRDVPEACDNTLWIAERADVDIEFGKPQLPDFPIPRASPTTPLPRPPHVGGCRSAGATTCRRVVERLAYELQVIKNMGFASYFLIVWDLIKHARDAGSASARAAARRPVRRRLRPAHHRPRPDPLRPAVRALPQPEPHLDARHRHGLRLPLTGTR
jgi:DNA polymerase-3 subunit alpha